MPDTVLMSTPFCSAMGSDPSAAGGGKSEVSEWQRSARNEPASTGEVSAGHRNRMRRSWNLTFGMPALSSTRFSILFTLSGEMGPPLGEGNTYWSLVFRFCSRRTSIAWGEMLTAR